jgi:hypothetical protein
VALPVSAGVTARLEGVLPGAARLWAALITACIVGVPVKAADLAAPAEQPFLLLPGVYFHAGVAGVFFEPNAQPTGGGLFTTANVAIPPA